VVVPAHCRTWLKYRERASAYAQTFEADAAWTIVFRFYAALHLTQAYLLAKGIPRFEASSHAERDRAIRDATELTRRFSCDYRDLKNLSESVRYDPDFVATPNDHQNAQAWLGVVESIVKPKLKSKGFDPEQSALQP
jgi:hypothetical protein